MEARNIDQPACALTPIINELNSLANNRIGQINYLCELSQDGQLLPYIKDSNDYQNLYRAIDPYWTQYEDHLTGLPLDFAQKNASSFLHYSVPDITGIRARYSNYLFDHELHYFTGLIPKAIRNVEDLARVLNFISPDFYAQYIVWFARMLQVRENFLFVVEQLTFSRAAIFIHLIPDRLLRQVFPSVEILRAIEPFLSLEKFNLLADQYSLPYQLQANDSLRIKLSASVDNFFGQRFFIKPKEHISLTRIEELVNSIVDAESLVDVLKTLDRSNQNKVLHTLGRNLFHIIPDLLSYQTVRNYLPYGADLDKTFLMHGLTTQDLKCSLKNILLTHEKAIDTKFQPVIPSELKETLKSALRILHSAASLRECLSDFPSLARHIFWIAGEDLFRVINNRKDYFTLDNKGQIGMCDILAEHVKTVKDMAIIFNCAPIASLYYRDNDGDGDYAHRSRVGNIRTLVSALKEPASLQEFFLRISLDRGLLFIKNVHKLFAELYSHETFLEICAEVGGKKGKALANLYEQYYPAPASNLLFRFLGM